MSSFEKHYAGLDITSSDNNGKMRPVSRVTLYVDDENVITAGDDTGLEISAECPNATQAIANALLARFKGFQYQAMSANDANIDPAVELGDSVTADGMYSVIARISDDGSGYVSVSAPGEEELEDEYPMDGPVTRALKQSFDRKIADTRASITKTSEEILLEVAGKYSTKEELSNAETELRGAISVSAEQITSEVSKKYSTKSELSEAKESAAADATSKANKALADAKADTTNRLKSYSTTTEMNSAISQSADNITSTVKKTYSTKTELEDAKADISDATDEKLKSYSTTLEMHSAIEQSANNITSTVSETYSTKTETTSAANTALDNAKADTDEKLKNYSTTAQVESKIEQSANSIKSTVEATYATNESLATFTNSVNKSISGLQSQIDGQIETYYYDYVPTLDNAPASGWKDESEKAKHEGDLFFNKANGYSYRFFKDSDKTWKWQLVRDTDITKALADASTAKSTADGKRRVFTKQPTPPYDEGDLWVEGSNGDIKYCKTAKTSGSYSSADWDKASKYTDDTTANSAKTIATQTSNKFSWLVKSGTSSSDFEITDRLASLTATHIDLSGYVTINSLKDGGTTTIDGSRITTGTIAAERLNLSAYRTAADTDIKISSEITGLKNGLSLSVTNGESTSSLSLTSDGTEISSATITFNGLVNFVSKSDIYSAGKTTINGGKITAGSISADKLSVTDLSALNATIGGWSIASSGIRYVTGDKNHEIVVRPQQSDLNLGVIYVGESTNGGASYSYPFRLNGDGSFTATKATITGNITATSGSFTGTVNATSGSFTGTVNATSGSFTGKIEASSGNIGDWQINSNGIIYETANGLQRVTLRGLGAGSTGNGVFYIGTRTSASGSFTYPFRVDIDGTCRATKFEMVGGTASNPTITGATLSGTTTNSGAIISGGTFSGGIISGGTLSSSTGGTYVGTCNRSTLSSCSLGGTSLTVSGGSISNGYSGAALVGTTYATVRGGSGFVGLTSSEVTASPKLMVYGDFNCNGEKKRVIRTSHFGTRGLSAYETPLPTFSDYGTAALDETGVFYIVIDPIFAETVNDAYLPTVFLTKYGEGDIWVEHVAHDIVTVRGTPGLAFAWETRYAQANADVMRLCVKDFDYQDMSTVRDFEGEAAVAYEHSKGNINYAEMGYEYYNEFERSLSA